MSKKSHKRTKRAVVVEEEEDGAATAVRLGVAKEYWDELIAMHEYMRPHYSRSEDKFINRFLRPLGISDDPVGNCYKLIGDENPKVLWSAHTDTVHAHPGRQHVKVQGRWLKLDRMRSMRATCLGADDSAGIWILCQMIRAEIPGLYIFHRGEEHGCLGSKWIAENLKDVVKDIKMAIAFDRMGDWDIITHQRAERCCSDAFADSLSKELDLGLTKAHGMFTDTASYATLIPECTNVSVGYKQAHGINEELDLIHLFHLRNAVLGLDVDKLVIARDPKKKEYSWKDWESGAYTNGYGTGAAKVGLPKGVKLIEAPKAAHRTCEPVKEVTRLLPTEQPFNRIGKEFKGTFTDEHQLEKEAQQDWVKESKLVTLADFCRSYPNEVADYLEHCGYEVDDIRTYVDGVYSKLFGEDAPKMNEAGDAEGDDHPPLG